MTEFTMDSTVGEILGEPESGEVNPRLLELLRIVFRKLAPDRRWYVDRTYANQRAVNITMSDNKEMTGTSLELNTGDIGCEIYRLILTLTHHHDWHKPISLGSLTIAPQDRIVPFEKIGENNGDWKTFKQWYLPLEEQLKFLKGHPELSEKLFVGADILGEVNEIRAILGEEKQ